MSDIIITCAVTGSIHTPAMSPHLPVTADQVTDHRAFFRALGVGESSGKEVDDGLFTPLEGIRPFHRGFS